MVAVLQVKSEAEHRSRVESEGTTGSKFTKTWEHETWQSLTNLL